MKNESRCSRPALGVRRLQIYSPARPRAATFAAESSRSSEGQSSQPRVFHNPTSRRYAGPKPWRVAARAQPPPIKPEGTQQHHPADQGQSALFRSRYQQQNDCGGASFESIRRRRQAERSGMSWTSQLESIVASVTTTAEVRAYVRSGGVPTVWSSDALTMCTHRSLDAPCVEQALRELSTSVDRRLTNLEKAHETLSSVLQTFVASTDQRFSDLQKAHETLLARVDQLPRLLAAHTARSLQ